MNIRLRVTVIQILLFIFILAGVLPSRLLAQAGTLDTAYNPRASSYVYALALQADGKVVLGGRFGGRFGGVGGVARNYIARLNIDGSVDTAFDPGTGPNGYVYALALQADGKVVLGGHSVIARLNPDGSVDTAFNPGAGPNNDVDALALQADGKVVLGGDFETVGGVKRSGIARLNPDGSVDTAFDPGAGPNGDVYALALQADGKVVLGGSFASVGGVTCSGIARLNTDGSVDTAFDPGAGVNGIVYALAVQADGKMVLGGSFASVGGVPRSGIARLNTDGSLDLTFDPGAETNRPVESLALQADGKVVLGGNFETVGGVKRIFIARLNTDGSVDTAFDPGAGPNGDVYALALQANGKVVLGGDFSTVNGVSRPYIARLNGDPNASAPSITSGPPPDGKVGAAYSFQVTATNKPTSVTASGLPPGLAIDTATGAVSGTPSQAGTFTGTLSATNANGTGSANFSLTILPATPVITSPGSASAQVGQAFSYQIVATNGPTSYAVPGLPTGLSLDTTTGKITGTPINVGKAAVTLSATNSGGTGSAKLTVTITATLPPAVPQITSAASDTAQVGQTYQFPIVATNNPTSFASDPSPPCPGLTLNPSTGVISGKLTQAGKFTVALTASNASGASPQATFTLNVAAAPAGIYGFDFASPPSQSQLVSGNTVPVYVQVLHGAGTLSSLVLYADDGTTKTEIGRSSSDVTYFGFNWRLPSLSSAEQYTLSAVATDSSGVANTFTLPIEVVSPPSSNPVSSIQLLPDLSGRNFIPGSMVTLVPVAGNADAEVKMVGVYDANGTAIAQTTKPQFVGGPSRIFPPISYPVKSVVARLTATVTNTNNCSNPSIAAILNPTTAQVDLTSLTCAITSPAADSNGNATVAAGRSFPVTASAARENGTVKTVEYFVDGGLVGSSRTAPFTVTVPALAAGQHTLTAIATDNGGVPLSRQAAPVTLTAQAPPVLTSPTTAAATQGTAFSYQITATNDPTSYAATGLPTGLSVNPTTGVISGTPRNGGTAAVTISAVNVAGTASEKLTITIKAGAPVITSVTSAAATVGQAFTYQISATNSPTSYAATGLPTGLSLDTTTGKITGTPRNAGAAAVTVSAANAAGTGSEKVTITIKAV